MEKAPEFKVGDRVRRTKGDNNGFHPGQTGVIVGITWGYDVLVDNTDKVSKANDPKFLELVETKDELDQLIEDVNNGKKSLHKIATKYWGEVQYVIGGKVESFGPPDSYKNVEIRLERIPSKPRFTPFTTSNGWRVFVSNDYNFVQIGCQCFNRKDFLKALVETYVHRNISHPLREFDNNKNSTGNFIFLLFNGDLVWRGHVLKQDDAKRLLQELEKLDNI